MKQLNKYSCLCCEQQKGNRHCPVKKGDICPKCCGENRSIGFGCPMNCLV